MPDVYDLYLTQWPLPNALAVGSGRPMIVVFSSSLLLFEPDELETVLAHEVGHILSDHVLYQTALAIVLQLVPLGRIPALAGLPLVAIRSALLEWSRAAELSSDRAATLVENRDPLVTARTLMVLAGGVLSSRLHLDAFLKPGQDFHAWSSSWDRVSRQVSQLNLTHSFPVRRVPELMDWVQSGEYDRIVGGAYRTRDQPPDPRGPARPTTTTASASARSSRTPAIRSSGDHRMAEWLKGGWPLRVTRAGRPVPRLHLFPHRSGVAPATGRGALGGEGAVRGRRRRVRPALRAAPSSRRRPARRRLLPWKITQRHEDLGELGAALSGTQLGGWLETPYSYLATTKASEYTSARRARKIAPKVSPYLIVYRS